MYMVDMIIGWRSSSLTCATDTLFSEWKERQQAAEKGGPLTHVVMGSGMARLEQVGWALWVRVGWHGTPV